MRRILIAAIAILATAAPAAAQPSANGQSQGSAGLPHSIIFDPLYNVLRPAGQKPQSQRQPAPPPLPSYGNGTPVPPQNLPPDMGR